MFGTNLNFSTATAFQIIAYPFKIEQTFVFLFAHKNYQFCRF
jgi:hypothetical protein